MHQAQNRIFYNGACKETHKTPFVCLSQRLLCLVCLPCALNIKLVMQIFLEFLFAAGVAGNVPGPVIGYVMIHVMIQLALSS